MSKIHFILTGGTIEKSYDPTTEKPEFRHLSILPDYFDSIIKTYPDLTFETLAQIDSLDMTDDLRSKIVKAVQKSAAKHIIIVHGTSTMPQTAEYLAKHLGEHGKTIILTGAMIPLKEFAMSDAGFNLGYAMAKAEDTPSGVYIAMNAHLFPAGSVTKNTEIGRFEKS
ncbi:MAG: asparaginase domain-containing protein [Alphaproteobacteria bacterium]